MLDDLAVESISVGDEPVEAYSAVKYLGVWLDNTLDMKKFISDRCRIASLKLYNIRKIKKCLCRESLARLINAFCAIASRLKQCFAIWTSRLDHKTNAKHTEFCC